ncbi:Zinc finger RNA-binding protein [Fasciola gigantica]|uniref:Zinc finger RNA-binding protein n=1 Tax=Fasciola gigantica TaxID=46835 RepID=A0A504YBP4_FASGI|nr:Zinc finger RNA-binding protein [Fasciola gigantica]
MEPFPSYQGPNYPPGHFPSTAGYLDPQISVYVPPSPDGFYGPKAYPGYRDEGPHPHGRPQRDVFPPLMVDGSRRSSLGGPIDLESPYRDPVYAADSPMNRPVYSSEMSYVPADYGRGRPNAQIVYSSGPVRFPNRVGPTANYGFRPRHSEPGFQPVRPPRPVNMKRPRMTGSSDSGSGHASRQAPTLYCEICKVSCVGATAFSDHEKGQRHQKRLSQQKAIEQLKSNKADLIVQACPKTGSTELRCELCDIVCTGAGAYSAHLAGRQHQRTLKLHKELGKPIPATNDPLVPTAVAAALEAPSSAPDLKSADVKDGTETKEPKQDSPVKPESELKNLNLNLLTAQTKPPVGAEYVEQVLGPGGKGIHFQCKLCDCKFTNADAKEMHIRGRRHRMQYKKKVDPSISIERKSSNNHSARKIAQVAKKSDITVPPPVIPVPLPGPCAVPMPTPYMDPNHTMPPRSPFVGTPVSRFARPPQFPNVMIENRFMSAKHASLVPTDVEAQAMKTVITICEHALKAVSDDLVEQSARATAKKSVATQRSSDEDNKDAESGTKTTQNSGPKANQNAQFVEDRLLRGVVRVGHLGKSLLLRGDCIGDLVLVCSSWPTTGLMEYLQKELLGVLSNLDSRFSYELSTDLKAGKMTVNAVMKPNAQDNSADQTLCDWPTITVRIQLTSPVVHNDSSNHDQYSQSSSGAVKAGSSAQLVESSTASTATEQTRISSSSTSHTTAATAVCTGSHGPSNSTVVPANRLSLITQGEPICKSNCLHALDAINQAKWFQNALSKQPLGLVARVLLDYLRADELWRKLDEFAVLAVLDRILSAELQAISYSRSPGAGRFPFSLQVGPRPFTNSGSPVNQSAAYVGPSRLFRRFFEAISSGLLLQLKSPAPEDDNLTGVNDEDNFFAYEVLAKAPIDLRERVTLSAQLALRQIAFRQLFKVLRIEPTAAQFTYRRRVPSDDDCSARVEEGLDPGSYDEEMGGEVIQCNESAHQIPGTTAPLKRPCVDQDVEISSKQSDGTITSVTPTTLTVAATVATSMIATNGTLSSTAVTTRSSVRLITDGRKG